MMLEFVETSKGYVWLVRNVICHDCEYFVMDTFATKVIHVSPLVQDDRLMEIIESIA